MKTLKIFMATALTLLLTLPAFSQIEVNSDGRTKIGDDAFFTDVTLMLRDDNRNSSLYAYSQQRYGIQNYTYTNSLYDHNNMFGFYNRMNISSSSATGDMNGLYNYLNTNGSGTGYSIYNRLLYYGSGQQYGIYNYNYPSSSNSSPGAINGIHNEIVAGNSSGESSGIYNKMTHLQNNGSAINGISNILDKGGSGMAIGIENILMSSSSGSGGRWGIYNYVSSPSTSVRYGIYSNVTYDGTTDTDYGIYSYTHSGNGYSGYFNGNVHVTGNLTNTSDESTKENIQNITGALALITQLQPKTYTFKEFEDLALPQGPQYGFLAQEVEKVIPDFVSDVKNPGMVSSDEEGNIQEKEGRTLKAVNYTAMIPMLVQATKEQQVLIEKQQELIQALDTRVKELEAKLKQ